MSKIELGTEYMGLKLRTPVVVSSGRFTSTVEGVMECAAGGAGAVVLKSIFEEQMNTQGAATAGFADYPEAADYLIGYSRSNALEEYLTLVRECRTAVEIPVIASINCYNTEGSWVEFAGMLEGAGASGIELNIFISPCDAAVSGAQIESRYLDIAQRVCSNVQIPVSVKLPRGLTNPSNLVAELAARGVKGVSLYNRFHSVDIDLKSGKFVSLGQLSDGHELGEVLRCVSVCSGQNPAVSIAASGGVMDHQGAVKALMSGASVAMICSTLYRSGISVLPAIIDGIEKWAGENGHASIADFQGCLSGKMGGDLYERAQFMKYFSSAQ